MNFVTVYITNYNYGRYLDQAIKSVLCQTYKNIEILIFDDGSTDNSHEIIEQYVNNDRIKVIRKQNEGLNATIIQAFRVASGDYVIRLDADDWFDCRIVERLVCEIDKDEDVALVFPDYYEVDESGKVIHQIKRHDFGAGVTLLDQPAHGACTMVRKKHYFDVGGHNGAYTCQDGVDLWLALTYKYKVANVNEPLFYYRKHAGSLSSSQFRILQTRFMIYANHARTRGFQSKGTLAVVPVRKASVEGGEFALMAVAGRPLIDWTLEKAEKSLEVDRIVVISESEVVIDYVESVKGKYSKPLIGYRREPRLAAMGSDLADTVLDYLQRTESSDVEVVVALTVEAPFSIVNYIDTAIYSMFLYGTDSVDSVMLDNALFYFHDGQGLKLWQDIKVRKERDNIYVRKGGVTVVKRQQLEKQRTMVTDRMGHVIIDKISGFALETTEDLMIADFIGRKIVGAGDGKL